MIATTLGRRTPWRDVRAAGAADSGLFRLTPQLRRELVLLVMLKLAALALLYALFFSPAHRPAIDPTAHFGGPVPADARR